MKKSKHNIIKIAVISVSLFAAVIIASAVSVDMKLFPFYPAFIRVEDGRTVKVSDYTSHDECSGCHSAIHDQWSGNMLSNSFKDPVWQALWKKGFKETKGKIGNNCLSCHTPIGTVTRAIKTPDEIEKLDDISASGVQCDFCHTVASTHYSETKPPIPHNLAFTVDPGNTKRAQFNDSDSPGHQTTFSQLHTSAEFCGNCHNVLNPPMGGFPIERTFEEWKKSPYAKNGIICQDCHMIPVSRLAAVARDMKKPVNPGQASEIGPERTHVYTHEFVGGNAAMTGRLGSDTHEQIAEERLKLAASLSVSAQGKLPKPGSLLKIRVNVKNKAAGHNLPTSLTDIRQMWLEVTVKDTSGKNIYKSGVLNAKGNLDDDTEIFNSRPVDSKGKFTLKPWLIAGEDYNHTIPPKSEVNRTFGIPIPSGVTGPVTVRVRLRYRSFPQWFVDSLLGAKTFRIPIVDMAEDKIIVTN